MNKMWYARFGVESIVDGCTGLDKDAILHIDGKKVEFPELEAIVFVNLPSCYGGSFLWMADAALQNPFKSLSINDTILEVVGIRHSVHCGQVQQGISDPLFIGQGSQFTFTFNAKSWPMQVDGEPWIQKGPCKVTITHLNQAKVLASIKNAHKNLKLVQ